MSQYANEYRLLDEVKCKKHPKYKVMRQPRAVCLECWVAWIERNLCIEIRGDAKDFLIKSMDVYAQQWRKAQ